MESLENNEIPDVKSKLEEIEREVQRIEEEITEVRHVTTLSYVVKLHYTEGMLMGDPAGHLSLENASSRFGVNYSLQHQDERNKELHHRLYHSDLIR